MTFQDDISLELAAPTAHLDADGDGNPGDFSLELTAPTPGPWYTKGSNKRKKNKAPFRQEEDDDESPLSPFKNRPHSSQQQRPLRRESVQDGGEKRRNKGGRPQQRKRPHGPGPR